MTKHAAVIDLGSNTFHLLIVSADQGKISEILFRKRIFTGLSDGGVEMIKEGRINYGLDVLKEFKKILVGYHNPTLRVIGTAVLRSAANRMVFIEQAENILSCKIEIINGMMEADYIFKGISLLPEMVIGSHLIMDVGGGSTEFILINDGKKIWSNSYPLGVGILHHMFHHTEPISSLDILKMKQYILESTSDMQEILSNNHPTSLTGASGSFEVLQSMFGNDTDAANITKVEVADFELLYEKIVHANFEQRTAMKGLPSERVKLIVVGIVLKKVICDLIHPEKIFISPFALKEGVISEMI